MRFGILLILYIVNEFYLYSLDKKKLIIKNIIIHSLTYFLLLLIFYINYLNSIVFILILLMALSHFVIHFLIFLIKKVINKECLLFFINQLLNYFIIYYSAIIINKNTYIKMFTEPNLYLQIILALLLLAVPGNIIFKKLFSQFKPEEDNTLPTFKNAGATIGILERFLIFICLISNLYTSIGLIFTAKSIARYKRINDEPAFSEYYLIGTLFSLLYTIVIYFLIFWYL